MRKGTPITSAHALLCVAASQSDGCQSVWFVWKKNETANVCNMYTPENSIVNLLLSVFHYRKLGSASYIMCVRCVRWERERYREIERERERQTERERERERRKWRHLSSAEIGDEFCTFPCQNAEMGNFAPFLAKNLHLINLHLIVSPLLKGAEFTLTLAKNVALFETVRVLRFGSVKWRNRGSKHRNKRSNFWLHRPSSHRKHESN